MVVVSTLLLLPTTSDAKLLRTLIALFDTPHAMLVVEQSQHYATAAASSGVYYSSAADKTREFLAFGDAALDYYIN